MTNDEQLDYILSLMKIEETYMPDMPFEVKLNAQFSSYEDAKEFMDFVKSKLKSR